MEGLESKKLALIRDWQEIATFHFVLCVKCHSGWVVGWCIITGVVVAVNTKLNIQHACNLEL